MHLSFGLQTHTRGINHSKTWKIFFGHETQSVRARWNQRKRERERRSFAKHGNWGQTLTAVQIILPATVCVCVLRRPSMSSNVGYSLTRNAFCAFTNLLKPFFQRSDFDLFAHIKHKHEWHSSRQNAEALTKRFKRLSAGLQ